MTFNAAGLAAGAQHDSAPTFLADDNDDDGVTSTLMVADVPPRSAASPSHASNEDEGLVVDLELDDDDNERPERSPSAPLDPVRQPLHTLEVGAFDGVAPWTDLSSAPPTTANTAVPLTTLNTYDEEAVAAVSALFLYFIQAYD